MNPAPQTDDAPLVAARGVRHAFGVGATSVEVLRGVDLDLRGGEVVLLTGPSGSGKTTLLTLLGCLRSLQSGSVRLLGDELAGADDATLLAKRRRLGFIFQMHNLHESLTATQNVRMALEAQGPAVSGDLAAASRHALGLVGLADRVDYLPQRLSGGQKQRVAVARALVANPSVVFADEPTAALDAVTGRQVIGLLRRLADHRGTGVLIVTHDHRVQEFADRVVTLEDGRVVGDDRRVSLG